MKRILAIVLLAALCLTLVACGGKADILGEWKTDNGRYIMTLEKGGKGTMVMDGEEYGLVWEFDSKSNAIATTVNGDTETGVYMEDSDTICIDGSIVFKRAK